jgi:acyl-CoA thioester hydrolase
VSRDQTGEPVPQAPLPLLRTTVLPEWIDYNGHMSEAYYVLVFGYATDALLDQIGMDAAYRERTATSVYTVEAHISYLHEVRVGEPLRVTAQVLALDGKRVCTFLTMHHDTTGVLLATEELLLLHVDTRATRAAPFAPEILARLEAIRAAHAALPVPDQAGRGIALRRR